MSNNPFNAPSKSGGAMAKATESREIQEVQAAMVIAQRFPRDQRAAMDKILNACTRPELAQAALYSYNRGGQEVTGPSIRLAEAVAQQWGNLQTGVRELDQANGVSTVEAYAWDLETNCRDSKVFQVPHVRHTKSGIKALTDPRDIYEAVANVGARRKRACILAVIPGDVIEAAVNQCDVTMAASADVGPDAVRKMVESFSALGVSKSQIEARITNRMDAIRPAQMVALRKIYASLRDGISAPADWFAQPSDSAEILAKMAPKAQDKPAKAPADTGEPEALTMTGEPTVADLIGWLTDAQDEGELETAMDTARSMGLSDEDMHRVAELYDARMAELSSAATGNPDSYRDGR